MNRVVFKTYDEFLKHYEYYQTHECKKCHSVLEMNIEPVDIIVEDRLMHFIDLPLLKCIQCGTKYLCQYSKKMVGGCYKTMLDYEKFEGEFKSKEYRKRYNYCSDMDFIYDHRDYESIPGLCIDEEHSEEGFLTPVYFTKKSLIYFMHDPDYILDLHSETYGYLKYKYEWVVPFGINRNGKVVFWLGDLDSMDRQTLSILKPHNVESDHNLVDSEFYASQMCCTWSNPNKELCICYKKNELFDNIYKIYGLSLYHLKEEIKEQMDSFQKPIVFTEKSIEPSVNMLDKALIEGVNLDQFRELLAKINSKSKNEYKDLKSIKLYELLLKKDLSDVDENESQRVNQIISPLYLLHDLRIYFDHLLSIAERERIKNNIIQRMNLKDFNDIEAIYSQLIDGLLVLFEYLLVGSSVN